MGYWHALS